MRAAQHSFGDAAHEYSIKPGSAVRAHHDYVDPRVCSEADDRVGGIAFQEDMPNRNVRVNRSDLFELALLLPASFVLRAGRLRRVNVCNNKRSPIGFSQRNGMKIRLVRVG